MRLRIVIDRKSKASWPAWQGKQVDSLFTATETATYRVTFYGNTTAIDPTLPLPFFVDATVSSSLTNAGTAFTINHQGLTIHQCDSSLLRVNAGESPTLSVINTANVSTGLHIVVEKL